VHAIPIVLLVASALLFVVQPLGQPADLDALVTIAGLVATVLSLGLTVTLLVAQHTAEEHSRMLYAEFRRERAWLQVLGVLGVGVVVIVAASLTTQTLSTAWAGLLCATALGAYAATLLPRLLDSLDRTELARRIGERLVTEIGQVRARTHPVHRDGELKPVAIRGLEIAGAMTMDGIQRGDADVVRSGYSLLRQVLLAYVAASPSRGWDSEVVDRAFQHARVATMRLVGRSAEILLPVAIEELRTLGVESPSTLQPIDAGDPIVSRVNRLFMDVVARTMTADESGGAAMATAAIGASAVALADTGRLNLISEVDDLGAISAAAIGTERYHVAGIAHRELVRLAIRTATETDDIMAGDSFGRACSALASAATSFVKKETEAGSLMRDVAWRPILSVRANPHLVAAVLAGLSALQRSGERYPMDFASGTDALMDALVMLATCDEQVVMTPSEALHTAYSTLMGVLALGLDARPELIVGWWTEIVELLSSSGRGAHIDGQEMLSALLLAGVYGSASDRGWAEPLRRELLRLVTAQGEVADARPGLRARAWMQAGRASLGSGDRDLAMSVARLISTDIAAIETTLRRRAVEDPGWVTTGSFAPDPPPPIPGTPMPDLPRTDRDPAVIEEFRTMIARAPTRRRSRGKPQQPSTPVEGRSPRRPAPDAPRAGSH